MGVSTQRPGALHLAKWYGGRGVVLFILLALVIGIWQLWEPPVYASRATARVGVRQSAAAFSPLAMLAGDNIEDELAVLESLAIREHTVDALHLECRPVPVWQPNPFGYQVGRVFAFIFRTKKPLDYGKLAYPLTTELELNYGKLAERKLLVAFEKDGNYSLLVDGRTVDTQPVGSPLSTDGLRIALTGFTSGVKQRWRLMLSEPELAPIMLHDRLTILRVGARSNTIGVKCEELHPGLAARIVNTMMDFYIQRDIENKQQNSAELLVYVDQQIDAVQEELGEHRGRMEELLADQKNLIASGSSPTVANAYLGYQDELSQLYTEQAQVQGLRHVLDSDQPLTGYYNSDIFNRPVEIELAQRIMDGEQVLANELLVKTEEHPDVVEMKRTLAARRADLATLVDESLDQLNRKISNARSGVGRYGELLALTPEASVELEKLQSDIAVATQVLGTLYAQRQQVALEKESDVSPIVILDEGQPNYRPARPRLLMAGFVSVLVSLLLTSALLIVLRLLDTDVRNAASLAGRNGAPVLATLDSAGKPPNEVEARRLKMMLSQLLNKTAGRLALVATTNSQHAGLVYETCLDLLRGTGSQEKAPDPGKLVAIQGCGEPALYDSNIAETDQLILITSPGRKRLRQLEPILAVMRELDYPLAGWILIGR